MTNITKKALNILKVEKDAIDNLIKQIKYDPVPLLDIIGLLAPVMDKENKSEFKQRIIITGVGKNSNLATKASETFASIGIPSLYLNACHYSHGDAGFIGPNDKVIHISKSGKTSELIFMANHLKLIRPDVKQVLLCCNSNLPETFENLFDLVFKVDNLIEADQNNLAPSTSTTVLLSLLDTIGIILSGENFTPEDFYMYHPGGSLGEQLSQH